MCIVHAACFILFGGTMKNVLALIAVIAASAITASAQMVPFTQSGTSSVTPFASLALKNVDRSEYTFGAMYMTSFGLGIQADYGIGDGYGPGYTSSSELGFQLGYFPVWAGDKGGFNLGVVGAYGSETLKSDVAGVSELTSTEYRLGLSTSYTAVVSDKLQLIPFFQLGWEVESVAGNSTDWERGSYTAYGTHVRLGMGSNALVLTAQSSGASWEGLNIGVRYVIAL
jgi:hypothetical protein